jgi:RNA polymerase sigma factor (sigma-70 family)
MTEPSALASEPPQGPATVGIHDQRDFGKFFRDTHETLHRKAARLTRGHQQQTEDAVSDAYLRAWRKWDILQNLSDERRMGWIAVTLTNVIREQWRKQFRQPTPEPLSDDHPSNGPLDGSPCVPELAAMRIAYARVLEACGRVLDGSHYEVLMMRLLGFEHKEIAAMRATAPATVRSQVAHALKTLREDPEVTDVLAQLREEGA